MFFFFLDRSHKSITPPFYQQQHETTTLLSWTLLLANLCFHLSSSSLSSLEVMPKNRKTHIPVWLSAASLSGPWSLVPLRFASSRLSRRIRGISIVPLIKISKMAFVSRPQRKTFPRWLERAWAILRTIRTMFKEEVKTNICQRDSCSSIATKWSTIAMKLYRKLDNT